MSKVELSKHPFNLDNSQVEWVEETIKNMTIEEKIGQLFFPVGFTTKKKELKDIVTKYKVGGMMYRTSKAKKVQASHRVLQQASKIPMLLAANLEAGGNGIIDEGTNYGNNMLVGASNNPKNGFLLGDIANKEGAMAGCNMAFAPVIDLNVNFRNPVTNTRAFGDKTELVSKMSCEYIKGAHKNNCAVTIKHFPGDGMDGRDHHLLTTRNHLPFDKWMNTFGKVYKDTIKVGARGLMVGHITLPDYFDKNHPLRDIPASLNPVLLNKLLREELNYKGLTMTDATLMTGFGCHGKREDLVPEAIAAGCDMFLFNRNLGEEYDFMMNGYKKGIITKERLHEALTRILGLKAALNLNNKSIDELVPMSIDENILNENLEHARVLADEAITLVKDDQKLLPLNPKKTKNIGVMYFGNKSMMEIVMGNIPGFKGALIKFLMKLMPKKKTHPEMFIDELKKQGFNAFQYEFGDIFKLMKENEKPLAEWTKQFDTIIILSKMEHASNQTSLQVQYKAMGFDAPWFVKEIPTILVSTANPYQQYDFEMIETVINGYNPTQVVYEAIAEKLVGKSQFKGVSPVSLKFKEHV